MIEIIYQHADRMQGYIQAEFLGQIAELLKKEKANHIKSFTNEGRFFDILEKARSVCLWQGPIKGAGAFDVLETLAPEGFLIVAARVESRPHTVLLLHDLPDSVEAIRKRLGIPDDLDEDDLREWLAKHQDLADLWLNDPGLKKLRANPSLLNHL